MDYDFRTRAQRPSYRASPVYGHSMYPGVAPPSSSELGIRVAIKPEYHTNPPPRLSPLLGDVPRSNFQFDFDLERKILAEAEKESQNWSRIRNENLPSRTSELNRSLSLDPTEDPILGEYITSGVSREAAAFAISAYGDDPTKIREFVKGYTLLLEMGFSSSIIAEALIIYENDTDKALAHFFSCSS